MAFITLAATGVFVIAGGASGLLIDQHDGPGAAFEWTLRTLVVVAAVVGLVSGLVLVARLRRRARNRAIGWVAAFAASAAFLWLIAIPVAYGVYLTHLPARKAVHDADLGARKQAVTLERDGRNTLRGWYVPSRNGAAVIALHGTGGNRLGVAGEARLLVRHGYGVLALDLAGHGQSSGRSTSISWTLDDDLDTALDWLATRSDVHDGRIAALGISLGGEVALQLAARRADLRATIAEGVMGATAADMRAARQSPPVVAQIAALSGVAALLTGTGVPQPDAQLVKRAATRPLLLISAGRSTEAAASRAFAQRGGAHVQLWNLPTAAHGAALATDPGGYERHVVSFLDHALADR